MPPIPLPATIDTPAATPLRDRLHAAVRDAQPLVLGGADVERIGQAGLQVLLAGHRAAIDAGLPFRIVDPSPVLGSMIALAGLDALLAA